MWHVTRSTMEALSHAGNSDGTVIVVNESLHRHKHDTAVDDLVQSAGESQFQQQRTSRFIRCPIGSLGDTRAATAAAGRFAAGATAGIAAAPSEAGANTLVIALRRLAQVLSTAAQAGVGV